MLKGTSYLKADIEPGASLSARTGHMMLDLLLQHCCDELPLGVSARAENFLRHTKELSHGAEVMRSECIEDSPRQMVPRILDFGA